MRAVLSILFCALLNSLCFAQIDDSQTAKELEAKVIEQLNIDPDKIAFEFVSQKKMPNHPRETIMIIPEMAKEDEDYFLLNAYILIVNNETGKIINKYFDPSAWQSDAIILSKIEIDTAPYYVSENNRAFGIRVSHHTLSQPNPYSRTTLSLFVESGQTLKEILRPYEIVDYKAEWNMRCAGESVGHEKTFSMATKKTNDYFDILVNDEITFTESFEDENGDCLSTEKITTERLLLKFNGEEYTANGTFPALDVYLDDPDVSATNIRETPNGKIILKLDETVGDYFTLTISEEKNGWFRLEKVMGVEGNNIEIPKGAGWIHHSVIGIATRKDVQLLDTPGSGTVVGTVTKETGVRIKDKYMDWVQIAYNGIVGWVEAEWLCGNPVTTCP